MPMLRCPRCAKFTRSSPCEVCQLAFDFSSIITPIANNRSGSLAQEKTNPQGQSVVITNQQPQQIFSGQKKSSYSDAHAIGSAYSSAYQSAHSSPNSNTSSNTHAHASEIIDKTSTAQLQPPQPTQPTLEEQNVINKLPYKSSDESFNNDYQLNGTQSLGGYHFLSHLATGGMGVTWLGEQGNKKVVLKTPRNDRDDAQLRFTREVQALSTCQHQHIISLLDIDITYNHKPLIVIEYIPGKNLRQYLHKNKLSAHEFEIIGYQLALAIDHCHRRGIIHRDIKPENIMFNSKNITLIDFSLALIDTKNNKEISHATPNGHILGTPPYASPEQLRKPDLVNTTTDIYSYGILLDECIHNTNIEEFDIVRLNQWMKIIKQCCRYKTEMRPDIKRIIHFCSINKLKKINTIEKISKKNKSSNKYIYTLCILIIISLIYGSSLLKNKDKILLTGSINPITTDTLIINHKNWNTFIIKTDSNTRIKLPGSENWQTNIQISNYNTTNIQIKISDPDGKWSLTVYKIN